MSPSELLILALALAAMGVGAGWWGWLLGYHQGIRQGMRFRQVTNPPPLYPDRFGDRKLVQPLDSSAGES